MKKLKKIGWLYELVYLKWLGKYKTYYSSVMDSWLYYALQGDFKLTILPYGSVLVTDEKGLSLSILINNFPFCTSIHSDYQHPTKPRASRQTMNLFVEKYNEYLDTLEGEDHELG